MSHFQTGLVSYCTFVLASGSGSWLSLHNHVGTLAYRTSEFWTSLALRISVSIPSSNSASTSPMNSYNSISISTSLPGSRSNRCIQKFWIDALHVYWCWWRKERQRLERESMCVWVCVCVLSVVSVWPSGWSTGLWSWSSQVQIPPATSQKKNLHLAPHPRPSETIN